jgi:hypothetical protein
MCWNEVMYESEFVTVGDTSGRWADAHTGRDKVTGNLSAEKVHGFATDTKSLCMLESRKSLCFLNGHDTQHICARHVSRPLVSHTSDEADSWQDPLQLLANPDAMGSCQEVILKRFRERPFHRLVQIAVRCRRLCLGDAIPFEPAGPPRRVLDPTGRQTRDTTRHSANMAAQVHAEAEVFT